MGSTIPSDKEAFDAKYTNTNIGDDAIPYNSDVLLGLHGRLQNLEAGTINDIAAPILIAMLCAQNRGDAVPLFFADVVKNATKQQDVNETFLALREAINVVFPFIGFLNCVPACLGLVNEARSRGLELSKTSSRTPFTEKDWHSRGNEVRKTVYRGVGNAEVHAMLTEWFPELTYVGDATMFGYLFGGALDNQSLQHTELILTGSMVAKGATRQARSHIKASLGVGNSIAVVQGIVEVASEVAKWNGVKLPGEHDIPALAEEVRANLEKVDQGTHHT